MGSTTVTRTKSIAIDYDLENDYNILNDYITTNPDGFYKDNYLYVYKINNKYVFPFLDNKLED